MVEPARHKFIVWRGATFRKTLVMLNEDGTPFDLTGYTGNLTIQKSSSDETVFATLTDGNGGITFGPDDGEIQFYISAADTANFAWTGAYFTFRITSPGNDTDVILIGGFSLLG